MCPRCVWLRVLLLVCLPERVLLSERSTVIVPGRISVSECVCIRACLSVRVAESPLVPLSVSDLGTAYVQGPDPDADADHSSTDFGTADFRTPDFGTADLRTPDLRAPDFGTPDLGTGRIHAGERSRWGGIRRNALITRQVAWSGSVASVTYVGDEASDVSVIIVNRYSYAIS